MYSHNLDDIMIIILAIGNWKSVFCFLLPNIQLPKGTQLYSILKKWGIEKKNILKAHNMSASTFKYKRSVFKK